MTTLPYFAPAGNASPVASADALFVETVTVDRGRTRLPVFALRDGTRTVLTATSKHAPPQFLHASVATMFRQGMPRLNDELQELYDREMSEQPVPFRFLTERDKTAVVQRLLDGLATTMERAINAPQEAQ